MSGQLIKFAIASNGNGSADRSKAARITPKPNGHRTGSEDRRVQLVLALLEDNSQKHWELSETARLVNLSPSRLAHLFKSETGISIQQHLTQIRLAKAKHHLESSFLSIKEIAALVGFCNVTRFTVSFKSAVGTTPAQYRRRSVTVTSNRKDPPLARSANG
jgi:AraC family transcriptional regulator, arabinose operon regulatory protein